MPNSYSLFPRPSYPFSAPIMTPWLKYFCTKGYMVMMGREETTMAPYLIRFAYGSDPLRRNPSWR